MHQLLPSCRMSANQKHRCCRADSPGNQCTLRLWATAVKRWPLSQLPFCQFCQWMEWTLIGVRFNQRLALKYNNQVKQMTRYDKHYVQGQKPFEDQPALDRTHQLAPCSHINWETISSIIWRKVTSSLSNYGRRRSRNPEKTIRRKDNSKKSTPVDEFPKKVIRTSSSDWNHNCEPWNKGQPATLGQVAIRDCQGCEEKIQRCFCSSTFSCRSLQVCRKSCETVRLRIKKRLRSNFLPRWLGSALLVHSPHGMASQQPWSPQSVWFFA